MPKISILITLHMEKLFRMSPTGMYDNQIFLYNNLYEMSKRV